MKKPALAPLWAGISILLVLALTLGAYMPSPVQAGGANPPPFDFSDSFYLQNGINPANIPMRVGTFDAAGNPVRPNDWVFDGTNTDPTRRGVRILQTTGGFNNAGSLIYYSIMGPVVPGTFSNDAAGARARDIANHFRAFLFPRALTDPACLPSSPTVNPALDPKVCNRRQDNVFDTRDGYFSNNPLGLWILAFVVFTPAAFTPEGQKVLAPIAATNGVDLDGTPILTAADQIDGLAAQGFVEIRNRPLDGSQGFPWVI